MDIDKFHELDIILLCGLPGSGKSYFAKEYFKDKNRKRINRKEIRKFLHEMTTYGEEWFEENFKEHDENLVKHVERRIYEHMLHNNEKVLIDNTSVKKISRSQYINIANQMKKTIGVIFLKTDIQVCLKRNQQRKGHVPFQVISNLYAAIELPNTNEGFKEVAVISDY